MEFGFFREFPSFDHRPDAEALRGSVLVGTADSVTRQLRGLRDDLGLAGVLIELNCGGKVHHPHEMEAMRLLCQEVRPALR